MGVFFLDLDSVDVVVGAEGIIFVGCDVVDYATANAVDVKVVAVHKCHNLRKMRRRLPRLVGGVDMHREVLLINVKVPTSFVTSNIFIDTMAL